MSLEGISGVVQLSNEFCFTINIITRRWARLARVLTRPPWLPIGVGPPSACAYSSPLEIDAFTVIF